MSVLDELEGLVADKLNAIKTLFSMTKLEVKLARLSVVPLVITACMLLVVVMAGWGSVMGMLGYAVLLLSHNILLSFTAALLLNLILFFLLKRYLVFNIRQMSFEKTRKYFDSISTLSEYDIHEQTKRSDDGDTDPRASLTDSATQSKRA